jgi:hypothetical protein
MMPRYATTDAIPAGANMADERAFGLGCPWSKSKGPLASGSAFTCRTVVAYGAGAGALVAPSGSARRLLAAMGRDAAQTED